MLECTLISFEAYTMENLLLDYAEFTKSCLLLQIFVQVLIKKKDLLYVLFESILKKT